MSISAVYGKKFIQIKFSNSTGDSFEMSEPRLIRSVKATAKPGKFDGYDYITFYEKYNGNPDLFVLSEMARATLFSDGIRTKIGIKDYNLKFPVDVVVSIEVD